MTTQPTPGAIMTLNEHTYGGALVCPMNCTRSTVRTQTVTVLGPVAYEPSMTRVRTADGTARRCMSDDLTAVEVAAMTSDPRPTTTVTNDQGVTFHARLIRTGERYGLADKLTNDGAAMVEFFDAEADPAKFGPLGQFVSRYYVDTFNETAEDGRGIALEGSVPRWTITAANVAEVEHGLAAVLEYTEGDR